MITKSFTVVCDWCGARVSVPSEGARPQGWASIAAEVHGGPTQNPRTSLIAGFGTHDDICKSCVAEVSALVDRLRKK